MPSTLHWIFALFSAGGLLLALAASVHALLHKRDPRAALLWILVNIALPYVGALLYVMFGVNRSWRRVRKLEQIHHSSLLAEPDPQLEAAVDTELKASQIRLGAAVTGLPLTNGNDVEPLYNGEGAYPAMLEAIGAARSWIYLAVYIFEDREPGRAFIEALTAAARRGVEVYVLLDGVGAWYSLNRTRRRLKAGGVRVTMFLPPELLPPQLQINLRNHRKILIVDGELGFTGGMNIRAAHQVRSAPPKRATRDTMFRVRGEVLAQMEEVFAEDWLFATGERLPARLFSELHAGDMLCRTIVDGPGVHIYTLINLLVGAFSMASKRILIVTPYFLPPPELTAALQAAALRGVEVVVQLPENSNLPYVDWATKKILPGLIDNGVKVCWGPPPFDHSKLLVIDGYYSLVGSANLDVRSLRLNFELMLEVYSEALGGELERHIRRLQAAARPATAEELRTKPLYKRIWYAIWWLLTPYL